MGEHLVVCVGLCLAFKVPQKKVLAVTVRHHHVLQLLDLHDLIALHTALAFVAT
jgi:hypothetical protein